MLMRTVSFVQEGTFSPCTSHPKKGLMPAFSGLTREEEQDEEECAKLQLFGLLEHKREHRFFSAAFKNLIHPKFRLKPEKDPEWKPGMENQLRRAIPKKPRHIPAPPAAIPSEGPPPPPPEEPSTNLEDFASFFFQ